MVRIHVRPAWQRAKAHAIDNRQLKIRRLNVANEQFASEVLYLQTQAAGLKVRCCSGRMRTRGKVKRMSIWRRSAKFGEEVGSWKQVRQIVNRRGAKLIALANIDCV
jgi:hypothetical protein